MRKRKNTKYFSIILSIMLVAAFLTGCSNTDLTGGAEKEILKEKGKIMARVNGKPIYEGDLKPYITRELREYQKYGAKRNTSELEKRLKKIALDEVISLELIKQESRKLQIRDIDERMDEKLKEFKSRYQNDERYGDFLQIKESIGNEVKESIRSTIYFEEYLKMKGILNPEVPEEEIRKYYEKNKEGFRRKENIKVSHILITVKEDAGPEEREQSRKKAERIRKEILEGKDFDDMAEQFSEDEKASRGGDLGYIARGYMTPEFDRIAFSLERDALSEVVRTKHGYHIIKVLDKKPGGIAPYEDMKDFIGKYLQEGLVNRKRASHIKELKSKAEIEILLNES